MIYKISEKQIESVMSLDSVARYEHTIKNIADWEEAWGLYENGWALAGDRSENQFFLLWPAKEYAKMSAIKEWKSYEPKAIPLDYLLDYLLGDFKKKNIQLAVFYTPAKNGVTCSAEQFESHLRKELEKYD